MERIGVLVPYSGEFPALKETLLNALKVYGKEKEINVIAEFIGQGDLKSVERAIEKLYYQEDADLVTGYISYNVAVQLFDKINKFKPKKFLHCSIGDAVSGELNVHLQPENYAMISYGGWKFQATLGYWVARHLQPESCLVCTSYYDAGYHLLDCFRIGFHHNYQGGLTYAVLKNAPKVIDVSALIADIKNLRPAHVHVLLCGTELDAFIKKFDGEVDYQPTVSFAFPVEIKPDATFTHPSLKMCYTATTTNLLKYGNGLLEAPFKHIFSEVMQSVIRRLNEDEVQINEETILEMDICDKMVKQIKIGEKLPDMMDAFAATAQENPLVWQNPYLCI